MCLEVGSGSATVNFCADQFGNIEKRGRAVITVNEQSGVIVVSLARPPVNALDLPMIEKLDSIFSGLALTPPLSGVVLTGVGSAFSAGVDTKAFFAYRQDERWRMVLAITHMTA